MGAPAAPHPPDLVVGTYRFDRATDRWTWSDEVYAIHGLAPHSVVPTTALMLSHSEVAHDVGTVDVAGGPGQVRDLVDARGHEHVVAVTACTSDRDVVTGHLIDLTEVTRRRGDLLARAAIAASAESRGTIEQAVGAVAFVRATDPATAFEMLRTASNDANVPVRVLARAIVDALPGLRHDPERLDAFLESLTAVGHRPAGTAGAGHVPAALRRTPRPSSPGR